MRGLRRVWFSIALAVAAASYLVPANARADRLDGIKQRGFLNCGVLTGVAGFATAAPDGRYSGFDIDTCRAIAAGILGSSDKVKFIETPSVAAFLRNPELDIVIRRLTWTLTRENPLGLVFGPITYYDGQGFLVPKASGATRAGALAGKTVCVEPGEGWSGNLSRYSNMEKLDLKVIISGRENGIKSFLNGDCAAYSGDKTMLGAVRAGLPTPQDYAILPEQISKEPLAPLVRAGDDRFFQVVRWSIFALIAAEELGVSSHNIDQMKTSSEPDTRRLLGVIPGNGKALGLSEHWATDIIHEVGNYGEMFARNLGPDSAIKLDRDVNRLWKDGGLIYAPPLR